MNFRKKIRLGDLLVQKGIITEEQLQTALAEQKARGLMLGETLVQLGFAKQDDINKALCEHLNIDFFDIREMEPDEKYGI